jgi:hypothetical protein
MAQTQMCTNDNFDDSNRTPVTILIPKSSKIGLFGINLNGRNLVVLQE